MNYKIIPLTALVGLQLGLSFGLQKHIQEAQKALAGKLEQVLNQEKIKPDYLACSQDYCFLTRNKE